MIKIITEGPFRPYGDRLSKQHEEEIMKHFDRGERRKKAALKKRQAHRIYPHDPLARNDHLAECSCHMCGNARELYGPTIQELRQPSVAEELRLAEMA